MTARRLGVARAFVSGSWVDGDVVIEDGIVRDLGATPAGGRGSAVAGFVDVQVNGFAGVSFSACDRDGFVRAAEAIARHGVTSFLPTIPTAAPDAYAGALALAADVIANPPAGSRPLGLHLEGPFLSPEKPGAHRPDWLRAPNVALAETICAAAPVSIMTLAPELRGSAEVVALLRRRGVVVSAGHSDATAAEAREAFDSGVTMVTHLWNAQRQVTSREPGLAGVALTRPDVFVGLIADLVHVSAETLVLSLAAAGGRAFVVTDAASAAGLPDGSHDIDGQTVVVGGGAVRLPNGTLAGASVGLDDCFRNLIAVGRSFEAAAHAVTAAPAAAISRTDVGRLSVGGRADVVILDDEFTITEVLVGGEPVRATSLT